MQQLANPAIFSFGPFRLDIGQRALFQGDQPVHMGSRAFDILVALIERPGDVLTKDDLGARVWPGVFVEDSTLRVHIAALRKVLGDGQDGARFIVNVTGRGYRFVAPLERAVSPQPAAPSLTEAITRVTPAAPKNSLPPPLRRLFGRADLIDGLSALLPERRLLTVVGPGGIGKTTLAVSVATQTLAQYPDGTLFVDLASLSDPGLVPSAVASLLDVPILETSGLPGLMAALAARRMLIVLDNCEHVIESVATLVEEILGRTDSVDILATSREPLRAEGEWVHRLQPLSLPPSGEPLTAADALDFPAIQLFSERAAASLDTFVLTDEDAPIIADICHQLDGIPLAIELAAARVDLFGVRGLAARLGDRFTLLTKGRRTALPRQQTLRATLDWSFETLSPLEQRILRRLSIFRSSFPLEAARLINPASVVGDADLFDVLATLAAKSLVVPDLRGDVVLYRLLETTRAYAAEKLAESGDIREVSCLHARYCIDLVGDGAVTWLNQSQEQWMAHYGRRIDDIRAALQWAFSETGDASAGIELTAASVQIWFQLSLVEEYRNLAGRALAVIAETGLKDSRVEMILLTSLGHSLWHTQGASQEMAQAFARALTIADALDDDFQRNRSLQGLWLVAVIQGEYDQALHFAHRVGIKPLADSPTAQDEISTRLKALSLHFLGRQADARRLAEWIHALPPATVLPGGATIFQFDRRVAADTLLARVLWTQGFPDQAMRVVQAGIDRATAINHGVSLCFILAMAACPIALWVGDKSLAENLISLLKKRAASLSLAYWADWARYFELPLAVLDAQADTLGAPLFKVPDTCQFQPQRDALGALAGEMTRAQVTARLEGVQGLWCAAELLRLQGEICLRDAGGDRAAAEVEAEALFTQALEIARSQGALSWQLRTATSLAHLWQSQGRVAEGKVLLLSVRDQFTEGFGTADMIRADALLEHL